MLKGALVVLLLAVGVFYLTKPFHLFSSPATYTTLVHTTPADPSKWTEAAYFSHLGGPKAFKVGWTPMPSPGPNEALIEMSYVGLCPLDYKSSQKFLFPGLCIPQTEPGPDNIKCGAGLEGGGVVAAVGSNVTHVKVGDEVIGFKMGLAAKHVAIHKSFISKVPPTWTLKDASVVIINSATTLTALGETCPGITSGGKTLFVLGGATSCGQIAIKLAKSYGNKVIATCGTRSIEKCKKLGADIVIDYHKESVAEGLAKNGVKHIDVVYETVRNSDAYEPASKLGNPCFVVIDFGENILAFIKDVIVRKLTGSSSYNMLAMRPDDPGKLALDPPGAFWEAMKEGRIPQHDTKLFSLYQITEALEFLGQGTPTKTVIDVRAEKPKI